MILDHSVYSIAIAIISGIVDAILRKIGITVLVYGAPIEITVISTVFLVYAVAVSFLLHPLGIRFVDSFIFATSSV